MCGRYELDLLDLPAFGAALGETPVLDARWLPRYNVAPSQQVPILRRNRDGHLEAALVKWACCPYWSKQAKFSYSTIDARVETLERQPAFNGSFKWRRCLVPATAWYE